MKISNETHHKLQKICLGILGVLLLLLFVQFLFGCGAKVEPAADIKAVVEQPQVPLSTFALEMMNFDKCKGSKNDSPSDARRVVEARRMGRILEEKGGTRSAQENFILLMCIESRYRPNAKSPVGALGIAQVMPATGKAIAKELGLGDISNDDLLDPELNILIGYTYFLSLIEQFGGNVAKAAAAYNSGPASSSIKSMGFLGQGHPETGWYVANLYNLKEEVRLAQANRQ